MYRHIQNAQASIKNKCRLMDNNATGNNKRDTVKCTAGIKTLDLLLTGGALGPPKLQRRCLAEKGDQNNGEDVKYRMLHS